MASGELSPEEFVDFLAGFLCEAARCSVDGAILHVCMDWRHIEELLEAARVAQLTLMNICTWAKPQAGMGTFYRSQTEFVVVLKKGSAPHINTFGLGARGRYRANLWHYPSVRGPRRGVNAPESGGHPTVKPVSLVIDALRDCSLRGDVVLDPFGGSGTTLIAAERIGRRARLIELDPAYVDLIARRWCAVFGQPATLAGDGRTFNEIGAERNAGRRNKSISEGYADDQEI
jgi:DNA modification methylase